MCSKCAEISGTPETIEKLRLEKMEAETRSCVKCGIELKSAASSYYFHDGVYLCSRHIQKSIVKAINNHPKKHELTPEMMREVLIELYKQQKLNNTEKLKPTWQRQRNASKLNRNAKK
jgi:hypothetical protein